MPERAFCTAIDDLPRESVGGIFTRAAVRTDGAIVTFNWLHPGHPDFPPHAHPYDQLSIVLAGTTELEVDGEQYAVGSGGLLYIPAGRRHGGRVVGTEPALILDLFAPARSDYLHLAANQA
jgi:mannose-6-phosphate isomerase-like protein (cupin superfamily)